MTFLEQIMKDRGLTQEELARHTGVAQCRISQLLNQKTTVLQPEKKKLESWFDQPIEVLLGGEEDG